MADTPTEDEVRAWLGSMRAFGAVLTSHHPRELAASALALLDEARKDRERLDWLDSKEEISIGHLMDDVFRGIRYVDSGMWGSGPTIRAAIDQARGA